MTDLAPIILFVYNRPWHTRQTLEALSKNILADKSNLFIYADGPKKNATEEDVQKMNDVRELIREKKWCKAVEIIERDKNLGLANSVITGVTEIVNKFGKIIVMEDDLVTSVGFLKYMNEGLDIYNGEENVMHISGYVYPVKQKLPETFFYRQTTCWGWGTWKRAWEKFNYDRHYLGSRIKEDDIVKFNLENSYDFYHLLLADSDGWAVRWYATTFLSNGLALHPGKPLVKNIGNDGSGAHPFKSKVFDSKNLVNHVNVNKQIIVEDINSKQIIINYFNDISKTPLYKKIIPSIVFRTKKAFKVASRKRQIFRGNIKSLYPVSRYFGIDRGKSIDRYYIEDFLEKNKKCITGNVLEVAELSYTRQFGHALGFTDIISADLENNVSNKFSDLTDLESLSESYYNCFICTQTLNFIYDFNKAIQGAYHLLKTNGVLLVTVAGVCQISQYDAKRWGDFWRFTPMSVRKMFAEVFGEKNISVDYYGNCLSAMSLLKGLASDELDKEELDYKDEDYPIVITIVAHKK